KSQGAGLLDKAKRRHVALVIKAIIAVAAGRRLDEASAFVIADGLGWQAGGRGDTANRQALAHRTEPSSKLSGREMGIAASPSQARRGRRPVLLSPGVNLI